MLCTGVPGIFLLIQYKMVNRECIKKVRPPVIHEISELIILNKMAIVYIPSCTHEHSKARGDG